MATLRKDAEQSAPAKANGYTVLIAISILLNSTWSSRSFHQHFPPKILIRGSRPFRGFPMSRWRRWIPTTWWPPATPSTAASIRSTSSRRAWGPRPGLYVKEDEPSSCQQMAAEPYQSLGHLGLRWFRRWFLWVRLHKIWGHSRGLLHRGDFFGAFCRLKSTSKEWMERESTRGTCILCGGPGKIP